MISRLVGEKVEKKVQQAQQAQQALLPTSQQGTPSVVGMAPLPQLRPGGRARLAVLPEQRRLASQLGRQALLWCPVRPSAAPQWRALPCSSLHVGLWLCLSPSCALPPSPLLQQRKPASPAARACSCPASPSWCCCPPR